MNRFFFTFLVLFVVAVKAWSVDLAFQSYQLANNKGEVSIQMPRAFLADEALSKKMNGLIDTFVKENMWPNGPQKDFPRMTSYEEFAKFAEAWIEANKGTHRKEGAITVRLEIQSVTEIPGILSIVFHTSYDLGGAHPNRYARALNIDLKTGEAVEDTTSLLTDEGVKQLVDLTHKALLATDRKAYLHIEKEQLKDLFKHRVGFTEAGLRILFSPYDVAAYAAGDFSLTIDYAPFKGLWKKEAPIQ